MTGAPSGAAPVPVQVTTPEPGAEALPVDWQVLVQVGWFLLGFLAIVVLWRLVVEPVLGRVVRRRNRDNPTLQAAVVRYVRLVVVVVATVVGTTVAGYGWLFGDSALVFSAVALAVGIAAQEVVGSLVSGVALVLDPEFNVGDYIRWEGGEGVVESIALRVTRVETVGGELVTIPNTILTSHEIVRPYGRGNHRVVHDLSIAYEDDPAAALTLLEAVAAETDGVLAEPAPEAYVHDLEDDAVALRVHYWITDPDRREVIAVRSAYARAAKARLERAGFSVSPPEERAIQGRLDVDDGTRGP